MAISKAKKTTDLTNESVTFTFASGEIITARLDALPNDIVRQLALHGLSQKIGDSYANGDVVPYDAASNVYSMLQTGSWKVAVNSGGQLAQALCDVTGKELDECKEVLSAMDDKAKKLLRQNPEIGKALAAIKLAAAEKAASNAPDTGIDLAGLFGG